MLLIVYNVHYKQHNANVAQMVEQRIENPCVTGSIPVFGTMYCPFNSVDRVAGFEPVSRGFDSLKGLHKYRMGYKHNDYVKFIQQSVESVCPYDDEQKRRLYHAGFLAAYLAKMLEKDPYSVREFKRHMEQVKKLNKPL